MLRPRPPRPRPLTSQSDNVFAQLETALKALAMLAYRVLQCTRPGSDAAGYAALMRELDAAMSRLEHLAATYASLAQPYTDARGADVRAGARAVVAALHELAPFCGDVLGAVPHGADLNTAHVAKLTSLAASFRDQASELTQLLAQVRQAGTRLCARYCGIALPATIAKLGGKSLLGNYYQWRTVSLGPHTFSSWPPGQESKKKTTSLAGVTIDHVTPKTDAKLYARLLKYGADEVPAGVTAITKPAFLQLHLPAKDQILVVPFADVDGWVKAVQLAIQGEMPL